MPHDLMEERAARAETRMDGPATPSHEKVRRREDGPPGSIFTAKSACALPRRSRHWHVRAVEAACGSTYRDRERMGVCSGKSVIFSG